MGIRSDLAPVFLRRSIGSRRKINGFMLYGIFPPSLLWLSFGTFPKKVLNLNL